MIPTINLSSSTQDDIAKALHDACTDIGFFYLEGHSISQSLLDDVFIQSKQLFALPLDEKEALIDSILQRGYTKFEEETLDPANQSKGDTKEGYYIGDEIETINTSKLEGPNVWPSDTNTTLTHDQCKQFRLIMERYQEEATRVCRQLLTYFALAIGSKDTHLFDEFFTQPKTFIRLLHYSSECSNTENGIYACGAHSGKSASYYLFFVFKNHGNAHLPDYGMLTLLLTDDNPGLEVQMKDNSWISIPPRRGTFVVNIGDMFERWTNGKFRSTVHRVITPKNANERYSIPFFFEPNFDSLVKCLDTCTDKDNPPKYPPITAGQHLLNMYAQTHADFDYQGEKKV